MAVSVVESMKNLSRQGKTIVCTIHQPSSEIFDLFDQLCLVAEGRIAFMGDLKDAIKFFDSQGYKCPSNFNPSDFYIKTLAIAPSDRENCLAKVKVINQK
jgi:ATP-binding cassette, subfamily G (WHITE), eye pigment precursor transporter